MIFTRRPFHLESVQIIRPRLSRHRVPFERRRLPGVRIGIRPEMQRRSDLLVANIHSVQHQFAVSPRFHQIDFPGRRPRTVRVVLGHKPNRRPQPVTGRHLGAHLNLTVFEGKRIDRPESGTAHWIQQMGLGTGSFATPVGRIGAANSITFSY